MDSTKTIDEQSVGYLLYHLTALLHRTVKKELDRLNITHTQFIILATLYRLENGNDIITQIDIARESQTDKMMVSKILRNLIQKKLVTRSEHSSDTRAKVIQITPLGESLFKEAYQIIKKVETKFFEPLANDKLKFANQISLILKSNLK
jgi:DNA-binding MarR family transcriptional regulator